MKIKAYRGTHLREGIKIMEKSPLHRVTYWITDPEEARMYAKVNKFRDASMKGCIIEGIIDSNDVIEFSQSELEKYDTKNYKLLHGKIGTYKVGDHFQVIILPKEKLDAITEPKLIEIV